MWCAAYCRRPHQLYYMAGFHGSMICDLQTLFLMFSFRMFLNLSYPLPYCHRKVHLCLPFVLPKYSHSTPVCARDAAIVPELQCMTWPLLRRWADPSTSSPSPTERRPSRCSTPPCITYTSSRHLLSP